jgi:hypothetical protein
MNRSPAVSTAVFGFFTAVCGRHCTCTSQSPHPAVLLGVWGLSAVLCHAMRGKAKKGLLPQSPPQSDPVMSRWRTRLHHPLADALCVRTYVGVWQHRDNPGGCCPTIAIEMPESGEREIAALAEVNSKRARLVVVADTAGRVEELAVRVSICCSGHRRVAYKRANAGEFGPPT